MVNTDWGVCGFCSWGHGVTEGRDLPLTSPLSSYVLPRHVHVKTCEHRVILLPHESGPVMSAGGGVGGVEGGCALITVTQMFVWYWFVAVLWVEARGEGQKYLYQRTSPPPTSPWYHIYTGVCVWVCVLHEGWTWSDCETTPTLVGVGLYKWKWSISLSLSPPAETENTG